MTWIKLVFSTSIVAISLCSSANAQEITLKELVQRNGVYYKVLSPTPYSGKVRGKKSGYLKDGKWDGRYIEIDKNKKSELSGVYQSGVKVVEWKFSIQKQYTTLSILVDFEDGVLKLDAQ